MEPKFITDLNPKQREAATKVAGPVLVLAGAGSGKTRTLTYRIAYLAHQGVNENQILAVTFTNKAAAEMRSRVERLIQKPLRYVYGQAAFARGPFIGTFHRFCLAVLREDGTKIMERKNFSIIDENDQLSLAKKTMRNLGMSFDRLKPQAALAKISELKNNLITSDKFTDSANGFFEENVALLYRAYQKELTRNNVVDFDDIIMHTVTLWERHPEILAKYQDQFPYVMVDEYQDTNYAQYRLVNLLANREKNIFVVGDDYQSIYGWRGANIENILNFEKDYPNAAVVYLEQNYRSTGTILAAAAGVIEKNANQKHKKLWTENPQGKPVTHYEAADEESEAGFIVEEIVKTGIEQQKSATAAASLPFSQFAVLYRINAQSRMLEEQFLKNGIPYRIVGGIKFYQRAEIKDIVAFLRFAANPSDRTSFDRIVNIPKRSIGKATIIKLAAIAKRDNIDLLQSISVAEKEKTFPKSKQASLNSFAAFIGASQEKMTRFGLAELITHVIEASGYKKALLAEGEEGQDRLENILELLSVADRYKNLDPQSALSAFLEEVTLATSEENPEQNQDAVTLMTLHMAKGLEFKYVFIPGLEEGLLPHSRSLTNPREMEEERRLCYVGITRARVHLWLISARSRRLFGQTISAAPSRFLSDIPRTLIEKRVCPPTMKESGFFSDESDDFWEEENMYL